MNERARDLFGFDVEEVNGNHVSSKNIAETRFRSNGRHEIKVPNFRNLSWRFWEKYGGIINALRHYILGHEVEVEAMREPRNEAEHTAFELDYLETLRENGEMLPYLTGLATHKLRLKYGDRTGFSSRIVNYVNQKVRKYAEKIEAIEPIIEEALDPAYA